MTLVERRNAFLLGILTNAWNSLNHAIGLVDGEFSKLINFDDKDGCRLVVSAFEAVEKAKEHFGRKVDEQTAWEGEDKK